jgi:ubiquinone/menaquinone biosynthesis C-methylase UbiE
MKYNPIKIKKRYDKIADEEDIQEKGKSLRTEIPRELIMRYLKSTDNVLDAGGGTGVNAIAMAKKCKNVTLLDISRRIIEKARKNVIKAKLLNKIDLVEGDIIDLKKFNDREFSFIVCVGDSISYVLNERFRAMKELIRVAKRGAIIFIGCDSKYGFMRNYLEKGDLNEVIKINETHETYCGMGPRTHVYSVEEMKKILEKNKCKILKIFSTPSITDSVDRRKFFSKKKWAKLRKLEMNICDKPELLGIGNHLLFIARKK